MGCNETNGYLNERHPKGRDYILALRSSHPKKTAFPFVGAFFANNICTKKDSIFSSGVHFDLARSRLDTAPYDMQAKPG